MCGCCCMSSINQIQDSVNPFSCLHSKLSVIFTALTSLVYRQTKQLLRQTNLRFTKYAVQLLQADIKIFTGLLTGHVYLNQHLTLMQIQTDSLCPMSGGWRNSTPLALSAKHLTILGSPYCSYEELGKCALTRSSEAYKILTDILTHQGIHLGDWKSIRHVKNLNYSQVILLRTRLY